MRSSRQSPFSVFLFSCPASRAPRGEMLPPVSLRVRAIACRLPGERSCRSSPRVSLNRLPLRLERVEAGRLHRDTPVSEAAFELREPSCELVVRRAQGVLRLHPQLSRQVGDREEQVAHLLLQGRRIGGGALDRAADLLDLLLDLAYHVRRAFPV